VTFFKKILLTTGLLVIGTFAAQAQYAPAPATVPPPAPSQNGGSAAELQALQTQVQELQTKLNAVSNNVSQQAGQIAPLKDELAKTVSDTTDLQKSLKDAQTSADKKYSDVKDATDLSINISWTLITGFLVMFMQAGFAMVETGFTRAKNAAHTMMMNFMVYALGMLGFWVCGFAFQFGGTGGDLSVSTVSSLGPNVATMLNSELGFKMGDMKFGLIGGSGFFLFGGAYDAGIFTLFLFQMVFMDTAATIPTGAMAERWKFLPFSIFSFCVGAFIYPIFGNWVWGGGWLAAMGQNWHIGHGHVDFAGSSVVHMVGGVMAFVGAWWLGPRIGKYNEDGTPNPIPGHNIPMALVGTFILAFGWFGFNPGSTLASTDTQIGIIATNTMLASAAGAVAAMIIAWIRIGKPDPSLSANGMLAGLVAITAPCAFVDAWAAVTLGAIAGFIMYCSVFFVEEKLKIDDPVGAISVHGTCGAWGVLSLGIFANGKYGDGWNNVPGPVKGVISGDPMQLLAEFIGMSVNILYVGTITLIVLFILEKVFGNRTSAEAEMEGLDGPEMGALGYNNTP
jgi:Amt family ammonium transporter